MILPPPLKTEINTPILNSKWFLLGVKGVEIFKKQNRIWRKNPLLTSRNLKLSVSEPHFVLQISHSTKNAIMGVTHAVRNRVKEKKSICESGFFGYLDLMQTRCLIFYTPCTCNLFWSGPKSFYSSISNFQYKIKCKKIIFGKHILMLC